MDLFDQQSNRLDIEMRERCEQLAEETGRPLREIAVELGRVMIVLGTSYVGNGLGLPAEISLPVGKRALKEFADLMKSIN